LSQSKIVQAKTKTNYIIKKNKITTNAQQT